MRVTAGYPPLTHDGLCRAIVHLARDYGVLARYLPDSRQLYGSPGEPDILMIGRHVAFAEVKTGHAQRDPDQTTWRYAVEAAGVPCVLWRESDYDSGTVRAFIAALAI